MLNDLAADILTDFTDEDGNPIAPLDYIERCAVRALPILAADLEIAYRIDGDDVLPHMPGAHRELWLVRSKILVCRYLRAQAAQRVSFSSGDKKMDRSKEATNWAALEKDLETDYISGVKRINPMADEKLIALDVYPVLYKRGSATD